MKKIAPKLKKLNLGSGNEYRKGWLNLDSDKQWNPDILVDIENGIPLKDNSIEKIFIKHVLEHISPKKFDFVMSELYRICKNKAIIKIYVPYFSCSITYKTIDHLSFFSYFTFNTDSKFKVIKKRLYFFRKSFPYKNKFVNFLKKILNPLFSFLPNLFPLFYERFNCWVWPMEELELILRVKK